MSCNRLILLITILLFIIVPIYLYNYILFSPFSCQWSFSRGTDRDDSLTTTGRIVLVADPQIEGDTRVYSQGAYGQFHNHFNDWYFWLIQRNINRFLKPDYEYILGDLFSTQYTDHIEYKIREDRFNWMFSYPSNMKQIRLVGNHDVGYGGEIRMSYHKLKRFVKSFGPQNAGEKFGGHLLVHVNSLMLDKPDNFREDKNAAWELLHHLANRTDEERQQWPILLFTHIPLYKEKGICADEYNLETLDGSDGHVLEQTMLTPQTSRFILDKVQPLFIFNGHDHEGCSYRHNNTVGSMEYTVRSIMGDYGGYIGLFEYSIIAPSNNNNNNNNNNTNKREYEYKFKSCVFVYTKGVMGWMALVCLWIIFLILYFMFQIAKFLLFALCCPQRLITTSKVTNKQQQQKKKMKNNNNNLKNKTKKE